MIQLKEAMNTLKKTVPNRYTIFLTYSLKSYNLNKENPLSKRNNEVMYCSTCSLVYDRNDCHVFEADSLEKLIDDVKTVINK